MPPRSIEARPKTIPVVAVFLFAAAALAAVVGTALAFPGPLLDRLWQLNPEGAVLFRAIGRFSGVLLWSLGAGACAAALGLLRGRKWAWWFAVTLFTVDATGNVVSGFITRDWLRTIAGVAASSVFLFVLSRAPVRRYFEPC